MDICKWCGASIVKGWERLNDVPIGVYIHTDGFYTCSVDGVTHEAEPRESLVWTSDMLKIQADALLWAASFGTMPGMTWPETLRWHAQHNTLIRKAVENGDSLAKRD